MRQNTGPEVAHVPTGLGPHPLLISRENRVQQLPVLHRHLTEVHPVPRLPVQTARDRLHRRVQDRIGGQSKDFVMESAISPKSILDACVSNRGIHLRYQQGQGARVSTLPDPLCCTAGRKLLQHIPHIENVLDRFARDCRHGKTTGRQLLRQTFRNKDAQRLSHRQPGDPEGIR